MNPLSKWTRARPDWKQVLAAKKDARIIADPDAEMITPRMPFRWISRSLLVTGG